MDNKEEVPIVKVGDPIYISYAHNNLSIIKVKRITKTQIILESDTKLRNDPLRMWGDSSGYYLKAIGRDIWSNTHYYIETEDLKNQYKHEQLYLKTERVFKSLNLKKLTDEQLNMLLSVISNIKLSIEIKSKLINKENQ